MTGARYASQAQAIAQASEILGHRAHKRHEAIIFICYRMLLNQYCGSDALLILADALRELGHVEVNGAIRDLADRIADLAPTRANPLEPAP